jgi:hypothetical protein
MSGYLTNLLRRALDPSLVMVQPRLNALFAPPVKGSLWAGQRFADPRPESMEQWTQAAEEPSTVKAVSLRPLSRTGSRAPAEPFSSRLNASSAFSSPEMHFSQVSGEAGPSSVSQRDESGAAKVRGDELDERQRLAPSLQIEHERDTSPVEAKPSLEVSEIAADKPTARGREERTRSIARAEKNTVAPEVRAALVDRRLPRPGAQFETRAGAAISDRSPAAVSTRSAERDAKEGPPAEPAGREQLESNGEGRRVLTAAPLPSVENRLSTRFPESMSRTTMGGRGPLSASSSRLREARLRAVGRTGAEEPTIEVTIGRIEVRGPAPAEPHRAAAKPSPGLNLEEYLRRRSRRSGE